MQYWTLQATNLSEAMIGHRGSAHSVINVISDEGGAWADSIFGMLMYLLWWCSDGGGSQTFNQESAETYSQMACRFIMISQGASLPLNIYGSLQEFYISVPPTTVRYILFTLVCIQKSQSVNKLNRLHHPTRDAFMQSLLSFSCTYFKHQVWV